MSDGVSGLTVFLAIAAPVVGFMGVMVGHWVSRGRELREMRRGAYLRFLEGISKPPAVGEEEAIPVLNEAINELQVVASENVLGAARKLLDVVESHDYNEALRSVGKLDDKVRVHQRFTGARRRDLVEMMRKDLLPWWTSRSIAPASAATSAATRPPE